MKKHLTLLLAVIFILAFASTAMAADLGNVFLITGSEIEIDYNAPVLNDADAQAIFTILVDGKPVQWEYLSYFDFGPYAARGGVVNVRITERIDAIDTSTNPGADIGQALDAGRPREERRDSSRFAVTQNTRGPAAAARVTVVANGVSKTPIWKAFYEEVNQGHMHMMYSWVAAGAGNGTSNSFSATAQTYTTQYVARQMSEGTNSFVGRAEYLNLPGVRAGLSFYVVGGSQSVYEAPAWRELYKAGETTDTYTRLTIPGTYEKPQIVTAADEVMRHASIIDANGYPTATSGLPAARPRSNDYAFAKDFFTMVYHFHVLQGSLLFPRGEFTSWDEYRYDVWLERAYDKAVEEGKWPNTKMMDMELSREERLEAYGVYGSLVHAEAIAESADGQWHYTSFPINTRAELFEYDHDLYRVMCGLYGRFLYFSGPGSSSGSFTNDSMKNSHPWFWRSQPDNYTADAADSVAYARPPLAIKEARIISNNQILVTFNRPVSTISNVATAANWRVYRNGTAVTTTGISGGYAWDTITLTSSTTLDNGSPYGRGFSGFTAADVAERRISNGGWLSNTQATGANALQLGEFVGLNDAIERGAGPNGTITIAYTGTANVTDWSGNILEKNVQTPTEFRPWIGNAYRSALTGFYTWADTEVTMDSMMAAAHMYESILLNNDPEPVRYPTTSGGHAQFHQPGYSGNATINASVTFSERTGQRIADGSVRAGGMQIMAGAVYGHHAAMQPNMKGQINSSFHQSLYVEGWGGGTFQSDEVLILKDTKLSRYKNENLIFHEGGHGWDSYTGSSYYANYANTNMRQAHAAAIAAANGRRYYDRFNASAYLGSVGEMFSTGTTYWAGAMREQFQGIHDGTWTPLNSREEFFRYDPYCFDAFKRTMYNGDLGMWYYDENGNSRVGDPDYRVIPSDWELLADTYAEFAHWKTNGRGVDNLIAWGSVIPETARDNPYTGYYNPLVNWISWNTPNVWDLDHNYTPNPAYPTYIFDFEQKNYYPEEPTRNQEHPFFRPGGVKKPARTGALAELVAPVTGKIENIRLKGGVRANLVVFDFADYAKAITMDNAPASFKIFIDGKLTHFTYYAFTQTAPGAATVQLRLEWPVAMDVDVEVVLRGGEPAPVAAVFAEELEEEAEDIIDVEVDDALDVVFDDESGDDGGDVIEEVVVVIE